MTSDNKLTKARDVIDGVAWAVGMIYADELSPADVEWIENWEMDAKEALRLIDEPDASPEPPCLPNVSKKAENGDRCLQSDVYSKPEPWAEGRLKWIAKCHHNCGAYLCTEPEGHQGPHGCGGEVYWTNERTAAPPPEPARTNESFCPWERIDHSTDIGECSRERRGMLSRVRELEEDKKDAELLHGRLLQMEKERNAASERVKELEGEKVNHAQTLQAVWSARERSEAEMRARQVKDELLVGTLKEQLATERAEHEKTKAELEGIRAATPAQAVVLPFEEWRAPHLRIADLERQLADEKAAHSETKVRLLHSEQAWSEEKAARDAANKCYAEAKNIHVAFEKRVTDLRLELTQERERRERAEHEKHSLFEIACSLGWEDLPSQYPSAAQWIREKIKGSWLRADEFEVALNKERERREYFEKLHADVLAKWGHALLTPAGENALEAMKRERDDLRAQLVRLREMAQ